MTTDLPPDISATMSTTFTTYGPVIGGMWLFFQLTKAYLTTYKDSSHWLAQGRRLAILTGALGVFAAILQSLMAGAPWTVALAAAVAAVFKVINPTVTPPAPTSTSSASTVAKVAILVGLLGLGSTLSIQPSCGAGPAIATGVRTTLVCEGGSFPPSTLSDAIGVAARALTYWIDDSGKIDAAGLRSDLAPLKSNLMMCAYRGAVAALTQPTTSGSGAPMSSPRAIDAANLQASFDAARMALGWPDARMAQ